MDRIQTFTIPEKHLRLFGKEPRIIHLDPFPWGIWADIRTIDFERVRELSDDYIMVLVPKKQLGMEK